MTDSLALSIAMAAMDAVSKITPVGSWKVVAQLPATGEPNILYFVPKADGSTQDTHDEYVWVNEQWEKVGSTSIDISGKMDKNNPVGTGSFSMNRKADTYAADRSVTFGYNCTANSTNAFACGEDTEASNYSAHAEGNTTKAIGRYSHVEGWYSEAYNDAGHAEGESTKAYGPQAHAEGNTTTAGGQGAHAEGYHTTTGSTAAHAEGYYSSAEGQGSHAEGNYCYASGDYAHAEGNHTSASGYISHAGGMYTTADCSYETVVGKYNKAHSSDDDKPLFVVGNGADTDNKSDALVVRQSGALEINGVGLGEDIASSLNLTILGGYCDELYDLHAVRIGRLMTISFYIILNKAITNETYGANIVRGIPKAYSNYTPVNVWASTQYLETKRNAAASVNSDGQITLHSNNLVAGDFVQFNATYITQD